MPFTHLFNDTKTQEIGVSSFYKVKHGPESATHESLRMIKHITESDRSNEVLSTTTSIIDGQHQLIEKPADLDVSKEVLSAATSSNAGLHQLFEQSAASADTDVSN